MVPLILGGIALGLAVGAGIRIADEVTVRINEYLHRKEHETARKAWQEQVQKHHEAQARAAAQQVHHHDPMSALHELARQSGGQVFYTDVELPQENMAEFLQELVRAIQEGRRIEEVPQKFPGIEPEKVKDVMKSIKEMFKGTPLEETKAKKPRGKRKPNPIDPAGDGTNRGPDGA